MEVLRRVFRRPLAAVSVGVLLAIVAVAFFAPALAPSGIGAKDADLAQRWLKPSWEHPFGTDGRGVDVLSRVIHGTRISLGIGLSASAVTVLIALAVGVVAGYWGGWVDMVLMRVIDVVLAFPSLLLAIILAAVFKQGLFSVFLALALVSWAGAARLVRAMVLSLREREFVQGALALGARHLRVIVCHILPNAASTVIVLFTMRIGSMILAEASLNFLGLGAGPGSASWGQMVDEGRDSLDLYWWLSLFPASAIALTVLSLNLLGDALRDALDPRLRFTD